MPDNLKRDEVLRPTIQIYDTMIPDPTEKPSPLPELYKKVEGMGIKLHHDWKPISDLLIHDQSVVLEGLDARISKQWLYTNILRLFFGTCSVHERTMLIKMLCELYIFTQESEGGIDSTREEIVEMMGKVSRKLEKKQKKEEGDVPPIQETQ